jgi:hypothetical protein
MPARKGRPDPKRSRRSQAEDKEIQQLNSLIIEGAPASGFNSLAAESAAGYSTARLFEELPISQYSKDALKTANYINLTAIQRSALPHLLCGRDVLGAAKTGSGKTLAFLLPVRAACTLCMHPRVKSMLLSESRYLLHYYICMTYALCQALLFLTHIHNAWLMSRVYIPAAMENCWSIPYTCFGSASGALSHRHLTISAAVKCGSCCTDGALWSRLVDVDAWLTGTASPRSIPGAFLHL